MALAGGIDIDIISGLPKQQADKIRVDRLKNEFEDVTSLANIFRAELQDLPGKTIMAMILGKLIDNIQNFVDSDTECRAYLGLLDALNFKINIIPSIAEQTMNKHLPFTR